MSLPYIAYIQSYDICLYIHITYLPQNDMYVFTVARVCLPHVQAFTVTRMVYPTEPSFPNYLEIMASPLKS